MKNIEEAFAHMQMVMKFLKLGFNLIFLAHLIACFWFYVSTHTDDTLNNCETGMLQCDYGETTTWWKELGLEPDEKLEQYLASLYWSFTTITTVGYGDITPKNNNERIYAIIVMIGGATVFGYIIGSIAALAGQEHGLQALTKKKIGLVTAFSDEQNLTKQTQDALKA